MELSKAPDWVREALTSPTSADTETAPAAAQLKDGPVWPLLLDAALVGSFLPNQLGEGAAETGERPELETKVLAFAETIPTPSGARWTLTVAARREVISAALGTDELSLALARTAAACPDALSASLRDLVAGRPFLPDEASLDALEARRIALGWLQGVPGVPAAAAEGLDHAIKSRRLLGRFERMVGGAEGERFFGRERDLERLDGYVGQIGPADIKHGVQRLAKTAQRATTGRRALSVWGLGGTGKTTLLAKFMLAHARKAENRFPFVYLDFDRTTISARAPAELLGEMCIQVAAQFPPLAESLDALRRAALASALRVERSKEKAESESLHELCRQFRELIDDHLDSLTHRFEADRPFLLVFDTFELVQYAPGSAEDLCAFVQYFLGADGKGSRVTDWPRLRLVLSGRSVVADFLGSTEHWVVDALEESGSVKLLIALAKDTGNPLSWRDAERLVREVARRTPGREKGVRPLRLHLIYQALAEHPQAGGGEAVDELIAELRSESSKLNQDLIDGILVRRILRHIGDRRVEALSDPGLVVRCITPRVIREVIAPATPRPAWAAPDAKCFPLAEGEEEEIFQLFRREVSLIEDHESFVRHRQDVRREMLPLIKASRPELFHDLHARAYAYFREDGDDPRAVAEAIYHGLWAEAPIEEIEALWRTEPRPDPRLDPEEFALHPSASVYVRARTGQPLTAAELGGLSPQVAAEWLCEQMPAYLRSRRTEDTIPFVLAAIGPGGGAVDGRIGLAAGVARLFYRAGAWKGATEVAERNARPGELADALRRGSPEGAAGVSLLRTWATIHAKSQLPGALWEGIWGLLPAVEDPEPRLEFVIRLLASPHTPADAREALMRLLAAELSRRGATIDLREQRLALLLAPATAAWLLPAYIAGTDSLPRDLSVFGSLHALLGEVASPADQDELNRAHARFEDRPGPAFDKLDGVFRASRAQLVERASSADPSRAPFKHMLHFAHHDWINPLAGALDEALRGPAERAVRAQLTRLSPRNARASIGSEELSGRRVLAGINQAGSLLEMARAFAAPPLTEPPHDFEGLCRSLLDWHAALGGGEPGQAGEAQA